MRILVTGGAGFIGHHFVDHILRNTRWEVVILDRLSYASNGFDRLRDSKLFDDKRVKVLTADFILQLPEGIRQEIGEVDYIVHMGGETHVDRSITDPRPFIYSNVVGTFEMLEFARTVAGLRKFVYMSTDEVFGPSEGGYAYKEWDRYKSSTPYSASKAGGEELCVAYHNTFNLPTVIIHTMNVFGERQHPEKFIPNTIRKVLKGETVRLHQDLNTGEYSTRCWIHARNVADAILFLLKKSEAGEKYNIVGTQTSNMYVAEIVAETVGKGLVWENVDRNVARPGHDLHYILDGEKMAEMGWKIPVDITNSLVHTIKWFVGNKKWLNI